MKGGVFPNRSSHHAGPGRDYPEGPSWGSPGHHTSQSSSPSPSAGGDQVPDFPNPGGRGWGAEDDDTPDYPYAGWTLRSPIAISEPSTRPKPKRNPTPTAIHTSDPVSTCVSRYDCSPLLRCRQGALPVPATLRREVYEPRGPSSFQPHGDGPQKRSHSSSGETSQPRRDSDLLVGASTDHASCPGLSESEGDRDTSWYTGSVSGRETTMATQDEQ